MLRTIQHYENRIARLTAAGEIQNAALIRKAKRRLRQLKA